MRAGTIALGIGVAGLIAAACVLVGGMLESKLSAGGSYRPLSSLRADEEGAKLIYESLKLSGLAEVSRHYKNIDSLACGDGAALFLGTSFITVQSTHRELRKLAEGGCKVLLTISDRGVPVGDPKAQLSWIPQWAAGVRGDVRTLCAVASPEWERLENYPGCDVAIRRSFGKGSIAIVSRAAMLRNDSFAEHDGSELLLTLVDDSKSVVFDEFHHGVFESGSLAGLARSYRLHGLLASLFLLMILFVWMRSAPFPAGPGEDNQKPVNTVEGLSAFAGLVNLLRRNVKLDQIPETAWSRRKVFLGEVKRKLVESHLESLPATTKPLDRYIAIQSMLDDRVRSSHQRGSTT